MSKKIRIVLIEDDGDDIELLQEAFEEYKVSNDMTIIKDGNSAVVYFQSDITLPDIIIMDFNLPKVHGKEVVSLIRSDTRFNEVPILILSTSSAKEEIQYAYEAGADRYLVKPTTIQSIKETVDTITKLASGKVSSKELQ